MIKRVKGGYAAASGSGRRLSKAPKSKSAALKQLYAVEQGQMRRGKMSKAQMRSSMRQAARACK